MPSQRSSKNLHTKQRKSKMAKKQKNNTQKPLPVSEKSWNKKQVFNKLWRNRPNPYKASALAWLFAGINWHIIIWYIWKVPFIPETFWAINIGALCFGCLFLYGKPDENTKGHFICSAVITLLPSFLILASHGVIKNFSMLLFHIVQFAFLYIKFFPKKT